MKIKSQLKRILAILFSMVFIICNAGDSTVAVLADTKEMVTDEAESYDAVRNTNYIITDDNYNAAIPFSCIDSSGNRIEFNNDIKIYSWSGSSKKFKEIAPEIESNNKVTYSYCYANVMLDDNTVVTADYIQIKYEGWNYKLRYYINGERCTIKNIEFVYEVNEIEQVKGACTFYDYVVKPSQNESEGKDYSINADSNYARPYSENAGRLAVGNIGWRYGSQSYAAPVSGWTADTMIADNSANKYYDMDANTFYGEYKNTGEVTPGIVSGLNEDYSNVNFNFDEPGLFSNELKQGKTIINGYSLNFEKTGNKYKLTSVYDAAGNLAEDNLSEFFPLDSSPSNVNDYGYSITGHDYYFGMRYDVSFKVGDYDGDFTYSFSGDDDLWVLLDGRLILDIGGIHAAREGSVNLKETGSIAEELKNYGKINGDKTHILTVLYMERGGNASNCNMEFVLPNVSIEQTQTGTLNFQKKDQNNNAVCGAEFRLINDTNSAEVYTCTSDEHGNVSVDNLAAGTYTLTESKVPDGYEIVNSEPSKYKVTVENNKKENLTITTLYGTDEKGSIDKDNIYSITTSDDEKVVNIDNVKVIENTNKKDINIKNKKTVTVNEWDDRTYDIDLYAAHDMDDSKKVNIEMALDISGSMGWLVSKPTGGIVKLSGIESEKNIYNLDTGGQTGVKSWSEYKYYILRSSEDGESEYKPIGYDGSSWRYIKAREDGTKIFSQDKDSAVKENESVYIKSNNDSTKIEALQTAVINFIENLREVSPESKVELFTFAGEVYKDNDYKLSKQSVSNISNDMLSELFERIKLHGNTNQEAALETAYEQIKQLDKETAYANNIILFTDGQPNKKNCSDSVSKQINQVSNAADKIKSSQELDNDITLYTAGIFKNTSGTAATAIKMWASEGCGFAANTSSELINCFNDVFAKISTSIENVRVVDYIDNKFDLILMDEEAGEKGEIAQDGDIINGGTVHYDSERNSYYIEWIDVTLGYAGDVTTGWHQKIKVKAKDNFIGGNAVATNQDGSGVYADELKIVSIFPKPEVNVKAEIDNINLEDVIFYGDYSYSKNVMNEKTEAILTDKYQNMIDRLGNKIKAQDFNIDGWYTELNNDGSINENSKADITKIAANSNKNYYAKIIYTGVGVATNASNENTTVQNADGTKTVYTASAEALADYGIKIVKGKLDLVKYIDSQYTDNEKIKANQTFIFKIEQYGYNVGENLTEEKGDLEAVFYETISFDANGNVMQGTESVSGLKKGYYTVTEEVAWTPEYTLFDENGLDNKNDNYDANKEECTDIFIGETLNEGNYMNNIKKEFFGLDKERYSELADGIPAVTEFINAKKSNWQWLSDAASAINQFVR